MENSSHETKSQEPYISNRDSEKAYENPKINSKHDKSLGRM